MSSCGILWKASRSGLRDLPQFPDWRDGRVVEGARLESVYRGNSIEGSNPSLSAILRRGGSVGHVLFSLRGRRAASYCCGRNHAGRRSICKIAFHPLDTLFLTIPITLGDSIASPPRCPII